MLGWVVVWNHAPHHIGGGIVCSRLLIVCLGAHSWQCPLVLTLGMRACALTYGIVSHGIVSSLRSLAAASALARGCSCSLVCGIVYAHSWHRVSLRSLAAASALARGRSRLYVASCVCATTQRCCCTNCTSCHVQMINVEQ